MAVETIKLPGQPPPDHEQDMGQALLAQQRKERLIQTAKIGVVWVGLVILLTSALLQFNFDPKYVLAHYGFVLAGLPITIFISFVSILIAAVLALFGAVARLSGNSIALGISGFYVSIFRGTPCWCKYLLSTMDCLRLGTHWLQKVSPLVIG